VGGRADRDDVAGRHSRRSQTAHRVGGARTEHGIDLQAAGHADVRAEPEPDWSDHDLLTGSRHERATVLDVLPVHMDRPDASGDGEPVVGLGP
jgi:hypothetical protein